MGDLLAAEGFEIICLVFLGGLGWVDDFAGCSPLHRLVAEVALGSPVLCSDMEHATPPPSRLPWNFHPALTEERLRICARMLANARRDALAMASYELGDDP